MAGSRKSKIVIYGILIICAFATFFPLLWLVLLSFKTNSEIIAGNIMSLPAKWNIQNYIEAWTIGKVNTYFFNSISFTFSSSVITLLLGVPMAYGICRMHWKLSDITFTIITLGIMIPIHATLIPVFTILKNIGVLDSYFAIILPYVASALPITVYIVRSFLVSVPIETEEAAFIDGCGIIKAFAYLIVPIIKQSLIVVVILNFLSFWNEYVMASTLITKAKYYTLPIGLQSFANEYAVNYGAIAAGVFILLLPVLITYLIFNDLLEKGMVASALK